VSPDPRSVSAGVVFITFTEDVSGVDIADFQLSRDGVNIPLTGLTVNQLALHRYSIDLSCADSGPRHLFADPDFHQLRNQGS
jgi:hypothetical protein